MKKSYHHFGDGMLQIETISSFDEEELVEQVNYFLKQLDEVLIKKIEFSSSAFFSSKDGVDKIIYTCFIVYSII